MDKIEMIKKNEVVLAIIVRNGYEKQGVSFLTPDEYSQQVAYMHHPTGKEIDAHVHNLVSRNVFMTQEVLLIKKGKLRVDFYDVYREYIESVVIQEGDLILLVSGGHGFKVLEEVEMIEIKQGPYAGEKDKERFQAVSEERIIMQN